MAYDSNTKEAPKPFVREVEGNEPVDLPFSAKEAGIEMTDEELQSTVGKLVDDAIQYVDGEMTPRREKAAKYYAGEPFGNEEDGRSTIVMTPFRDSVRRILPSILRVFFGGERYMEFRPRNAATVKAAAQQTEYIDEIVIKSDNRGYQQFYSAFTDALVKRLGVIMWWHEEKKKVQRYELTGQQMDAVTMLRAEAGVTIDSVAAEEGGTMRVRFSREEDEGLVRFAAIPPEEWLQSRDARDMESADLVGRRMELNTGQLMEMGYERDLIERYGGLSQDLSANAEALQRNKLSGPVGASQALPEPSLLQDHSYLEVYVTLPTERGRELFKVCLLGKSRTIVNIDPVEERQFALFEPAPEPHKLGGGTGPADWTMDLQEIMSSIAREMNNSLSLAIQNRLAIVEGEVNISDVVNPTIGGPIRMSKPGMVQPIEHQFVGRAGLEVLQFYRDVLEERVGVTKASAGLDPGALQSTTQAAVAATVSMAQLQIEQIARTFAETGVRDLMRGLLRCVIKYPRTDRVMRQRGEWVPIDPRSWDAELDVGINVALGGGLVEQRLAVLAGNAAKQEALLAQVGLDNPLVDPSMLRESYVRMLRLGGIVDVDSFWKQPDPNWKPQPPQPAPDAALELAKAEQVRVQGEIEASRAKVALEAEKAKVEELRRSIDLELKREEMHMTDDRERDKVEAEIALKVAEMNAKYNTEITVAQINADIERTRVENEARSPATRKRRVKVDTDPETGNIAALEIEDEGNDNEEGVTDGSVQ